jgi:hypothetical protein
MQRTLHFDHTNSSSVFFQPSPFFPFLEELQQRSGGLWRRCWLCLLGVSDLRDSSFESNASIKIYIKRHERERERVWAFRERGKAGAHSVEAWQRDVQESEERRENEKNKNKKWNSMSLMGVKYRKMILTRAVLIRWRVRCMGELEKFHQNLVKYLK